MTTAFQGVYSAPSASNINQAYSIYEGALSQSLSPIVLTTSFNYSKSYTATFTIAGTAQSASILINCSALNGLSFTRLGDVYTLSSVVVTNGVSINNWAYFKLALQSLSLQFTNSDISQSFNINVSISDGTTNLTGTIAITVAGVPDATGLNQSLSPPRALPYGSTLATYGAANIQIADPNQAAKTYRVTYTVNPVTNGTGTSALSMRLKNTAAAIDYDWQPSITVSGTQAYINGLFTNSGADGFFIFNHSGPFYGTQTISYVQEVLTSTEIGAVVPYVQETGTLTLYFQPGTIFSMGTAPTYTEDTSIAAFSVGTLTDQAGNFWPWETASPGLNFYTMDISAIGSFSGTNPMTVTYAGDGSVDSSVYLTGSYAYFTNPASPNYNIQIIPPADYTSPITLRVTITRGDGSGVVPQIYQQDMIINCTSTHADFTLNGSHTFAIGANSIDFGSITDLAVSKNYSSTLDFQTAIAATLGSSGSGGTSTWNATGGTGGFGRLTLTGTKTQVNSHLALIDYTTTGGATLNDYVNIIYTQNQTTNVINQGTQNVLIANIINWGAGNGIHDAQNAFVYDQDVAMTWDLASLGGIFDGVTSYTAKLIFSTPLSTANLGSVTGWTKETDYIWTKTGNKAALNAALAAVLFVPPAQLVSDFQLDIAMYNGVTPLYDTASLGSTKTVYLRTPVGITWTGSALSYDQYTTETWSNIATLNANFAGATTYTIELVTSVATGGALTGWTTTNSTTFTKTDTATNLQTALNSLAFIGGATFVSNFTFTLKSYRSSLLLNTSVTKAITVDQIYSSTWNAAALYFDQNTAITYSPLATLSAHFLSGSTYTIQLILSTAFSVANGGSITGWTRITDTLFEKTDTGANLTAALASIQFVPPTLLVDDFTVTLAARISGVLVYTSAAKTIVDRLTYKINISSGLTFEQDVPGSWAFASTGGAYQSATTYTIQLTLSTAFSVANGGSITGWTRITDTLFEKTDTGANLTAALATMAYTPPVLLNTNFIVGAKAYVSAVLVYDSSTVGGDKTVTVTNIYRFVYTNPNSYDTTYMPDYLNINPGNSLHPSTPTATDNKFSVTGPVRPGATYKLEFVFDTNLGWDAPWDGTGLMATATNGYYCSLNLNRTTDTWTLPVTWSSLISNQNYTIVPTILTTLSSKTQGLGWWKGDGVTDAVVTMNLIRGSTLVLTKTIPADQLPTYSHWTPP